MAAKKTARKAPKKAAKKSAKKAAPKSAKRSAAKKSTAGKSVKKAAKKSAKRASAKKAATYKVPPVPVSGSRSSVSTISTTPKPATSSYSAPKKAQSSTGSSNKIMFAVILGIAVLAVAVIAKGSSTSDEATTVTPTPAASESAMPTESASPATSASSAPLAAHEAPIKIVAHYTASGATVFWKAPATATEGITGYNLELRAGNTGEWKLVATVPATQFSQDITKTDSTGWAQVKVSTVYSDGEVVAGKIFGLPGSWA